MGREWRACAVVSTCMRRGHPAGRAAHMIVLILPEGMRVEECLRYEPVEEARGEVRLPPG